MRWPVWMVATLAFASASGQEFEFVRPDGSVSAQMRINRSRLIVNEIDGRRLVYGRERRYDSADDRFAGYVNVELNRVLRFPRSGRGPLQSADLDDARPRFRYTQGSVRPAGSVASPPIISGGPPIGVGPPAAWPPIPALPPAYYPPPDPYGYGSGLPQFGYATPYYYPQSVLIDSRFTPASPLPPVKLQLYNGSRRDVQVGLVDRENPSGTQSMRIGPGQVKEVQVRRDAGGKEVRTYRTISPYGNSLTKKVERVVPPKVLYEVVVHEWAMQSIAIDRTGKSPNVIEDINFQGKGLGRFLLPAGDQLTSQRVDVYRAAVESGLSQTVPPILATEDATDEPTPLERAVLEAQQRAQRGR